MASRTRLLPVLVSLALVLAAPLAHAGGPNAADKETARTLMEEGRELRDKKDLRGALDRFQRADGIMHVPTTGYELARVQVALGMLVEARDTLARVLRSPNPSEPAPFRAARKSAQDLDDSLAGRVPGLTIVVKNTPAEETPTVTVDDVEVPSAVLGAPRRVNPGHHVVVAKVTNGTGRAEVDVREGETKEVPITLVITAPPPSATPPPAPETPNTNEPPPVPEEHHKSHTLTYLGFGLGIVGVGVGAVTGVMTLSAKSNLTNECNANSHCPPSAYSDLDKANTFATVSTIAFIAGGVGVAVGVVSLFTGGGSSTPPSEPKKEEARVVPWIGPGSAGLRGTF